MMNMNEGVKDSDHCGWQNGSVCRGAYHQGKDLSSSGEPTWWEESVDYCELSCDLHKPTLRLITKVVVEFQNRKDFLLCITVNYDTCSLCKI